MLNIIVKFLTFGKFYLGKKRDILIFDAAASNFLSLYFEIKQFSFFYCRFLFFFLMVPSLAMKNQDCAQMIRARCEARSAPMAE